MHPIGKFAASLIFMTGAFVILGAFMQLVIGLRLHLLSPSKCGNNVLNRSQLLQISVGQVRAFRCYE